MAGRNSDAGRNSRESGEGKNNVKARPTFAIIHVDDPMMILGSMDRGLKSQATEDRTRTPYLQDALLFHLKGNPR